MSYTALYRKFRPAAFEDVKGQEHIITTLQNQIKANRIGHAYLFLSLIHIYHRRAGVLLSGAGRTLRGR